MTLKKLINGKILRCGYTTGSCAAAAAKAAAILLFSGKPVSQVHIHTPKGIPLTLDVASWEQSEEDQAICAVKKDSGDDPDITNGILIYAAVSKLEGTLESPEENSLPPRANNIQKPFSSNEKTGWTPPPLFLEGGEGIGKVTRMGLDQPVGAWAINSVPRQMISEAVLDICRQYGFGRFDGEEQEQGIKVVLSIPGGEDLAKRTFNSRIGIEGGLSIIGTTGILEPMSHQALIDTIRLEIRQLAASGHQSILLTPGNYGAEFAQNRLGLHPKSQIRCSNFIGDAMDCCVEQGFTGILLVGHMGKLVKLGIGVTNTHSSFGDGRMETLIACALKAGGSLKLLHLLSDCLTTDEALFHLKAAGILEKTMEVLGTRIQDCLNRKVPPHVRMEFLCFTNDPSLPCPLWESPGARALIAQLGGKMEDADRQIIKS